LYQDRRSTNIGEAVKKRSGVFLQDLRQALGMYQYGASTNSTRLQQQALGSVALALEAPQQGGAFPSIFWLGDDGSQNWADDSGWAGLCREEGSGTYLSPALLYKPKDSI